MTRRHFFCASIVAALMLSGAVGSPLAAAQSGDQPVYGYRVLNVYPHDAQAFTQGLVFTDGFLFESTGLNGRSTVRKVRLETGEVVQQRARDPKYFAEGLTDWHGKLVQLTWRSGVGFVYDRATLQLERTFSYSGEGWGLTHDGTHLILSDGTPVLRFLDPVSFQERARVIVRDRGVPVQNLNELEFIQGEVYANVWHSNRVARISPKTGEVLGWIDLSGLLPASEVINPEAVLNGIAYDAARDRLFVTGKLWPKLFEIRLERRP
ncbi:MAG TPA: glutaminyl-peptide cyclotransferase [Candidatus Acidoferrum sp.]|nr:glutaminyl-peptide cyclotransferase [Candidatus Acidoferrum sp.]